MGDAPPTAAPSDDGGTVSPGGPLGPDSPLLMPIVLCEDYFTHRAGSGSGGVWVAEVAGAPPGSDTGSLLRVSSDGDPLPPAVLAAAPPGLPASSAASATSTASTASRDASVSPPRSSNPPGMHARAWWGGQVARGRGLGLGGTRTRVHVLARACVYMRVCARAQNFYSRGWRAGPKARRHSPASAGRLPSFARCGGLVACSRQCAVSVPAARGRVGNGVQRAQCRQFVFLLAALCLVPAAVPDPVSGREEGGSGGTCAA
jgi:hypothetical protein